MSREAGRQIGGIVTMARHGDALRKKASAARLAKFLAQVDSALPEKKRVKQAAQLQRAHMKRLAEKSAEARRAKARVAVPRQQAVPEPKPGPPRTPAQVTKSVAEKLRRYGLSLDDYQALLDQSGGVCALCKNPPAKNKNLCIDHDHETGRVRGLLCHRCNSLLGGYEALSGLSNVATYLT